MSRAHSYSHSRAHSPTFPSLHLRHNSFSNSSVALITSQLIQQLFRCFTYVTVHFPTILSLLLLHFTYVTTHSPTLPPLYLRHSSFSNPSVASPTSQFILQPFFASHTSQVLHLIRLASRPWFDVVLQCHLSSKLCISGHKVI